MDGPQPQPQQPVPLAAVAGDFNDPPEPPEEDELDDNGSHNMIDLDEESQQRADHELSSEHMLTQTDSLLSRRSQSDARSTAEDTDIEMANL